MIKEWPSCKECVTYPICKAKLMKKIEDRKSIYTTLTRKRINAVIELCISDFRRELIRKDCYTIMRLSYYEIIMDYDLEGVYYGKSSL